MPEPESRVDQIVSAICGFVMEAFGRGLADASKDAPILKAREALGETRFTDAAVRSLRARVQDLLVGDRRAELIEWLQVPHAGEALFIADILAGAYQDIIHEAGIPAQG